MHAERETAILAAIIERYISTGEPVPSSTVSRLSRLSLSPASVRNAMSGLMNKGYLDQPHISAGRVPTAKAFRLYVDTLLTPVPLAADKCAAISEELDREEAEVSRILRRTSSVVSSQCCQLGVVLAPKRDDARWRCIEFSPLSPTLVLAVLVLDGGMVRTRLVPVAEPYSQDELTRFGNYLNSHFKDRTLLEARRHIEADLQNKGESLEAMCRSALTLSRAAVNSSDDERELFVEGASHMLAHAEHADLKTMRALLSLLEERSRLLELLDTTMRSMDWSVSFYQADDDNAPWAVVSAPYAASEEAGGALGVVSAVGPLRMNYAAVVPAVCHIAGALAQVLHRRFTTA